MFPVRYELNFYILLLFRMDLTVNSDVSQNNINRLGFVAEA
jgi:hypothetical protein